MVYKKMLGTKTDLDEVPSYSRSESRTIVTKMFLFSESREFMAAPL